MQQYSFKIKANRRPETLERLLRVIRHRGFEVISLNVENRKEYIDIFVTVESVRECHLLFNQLVKLYDVIALQ